MYRTSGWKSLWKLQQDHHPQGTLAVTIPVLATYMWQPAHASRSRECIWDPLYKTVIENPFNANLKDWLRRIYTSNFSWQCFNTKKKIFARFVFNHNVEIRKERRTSIYLRYLLTHTLVRLATGQKDVCVLSSAAEWQQIFRQALQPPCLIFPSSSGCTVCPLPCTLPVCLHETHPAEK